MTGRRTILAALLGLGLGLTGAGGPATAGETQGVVLLHGKDDRPPAFAKAPANPHNHFATVAADHMGTPNAAAELVVAWLMGL